MAFTLSPTAADLIRSTFFGKDFNTYRQEIIEFINQRFGAEVASNIVASEQGIMLIELVAFALSTLAWYGDRQADDTTLRDARLRVAAVTIARQLGYKAKAAVPATVELRIQLSNAPPVQLVIAKGQKCAGPGGLIFETLTNVVFDPGQVGSGAPAGMIIQGMVVDPSTPANVFLATSTGVLKTTNGGTSWSTANSGLTSFNVTCIAMDPTNPLVLYAGTATGGVFKSTNGATSWVAVNIGLSNLKILSIAVNPAMTTTIYVGTNASGVFKSINSGTSWAPANGALTESVIQTLLIDPTTPNTVYAGGFSLGVWKTTNGGVIWSQVSNGLTTTNITALALNPALTSTIYACTNGGGVFKTTNSGNLWLPAINGLTALTTNRIALDPSTPATIYVGTTNSGVFKSTDSAATWTAVDSGLTTLNMGAIAVDPVATATVYAGTNGGGVFKSTNGAATWKALNNGISDPIKTVTIREGQTLQETFRSNGQPNQFFQLTTIPTGKSIAQDTLVTTVGAVVWPEVKLITYNQTNQVEVDYGLDPPRLIFGDGIAGNIPQKDAAVVANYFVTSGTAGAVASNTVTSFVGPILAGTTAIGTILSHAKPSTPGSDPEPINSIKVNAPLIFQAAQRSVTKIDYDGWINSFVDPTYGAVAKGRATAPRAFAEDAEAQTIVNLLIAFGVPSTITNRIASYFDHILSSNNDANAILAQILAADAVGRYVAAPVGLAQSLENFLNTINESTTKVVVTDGSVNLLSVSLTVTLGLKTGFTSTIVQTQTTQAVFAALQTTLLGRNYGTSLFISDLYALVNGITVNSQQPVDHSDIMVIVRNNTGDDISSARLNNFGDLLIQDFEVITMGNSPSVSIE